MPDNVSKLLRKAVTLPVEARAAVASPLMKNLDQTAVSDAFIESMRGSLAGRGMPAKLEHDPDREFS